MAFSVCASPWKVFVSFREFVAFWDENKYTKNENIRRSSIAISFHRLWKRLIDHDLSKTDLIRR